MGGRSKNKTLSAKRSPARKKRHRVKTRVIELQNALKALRRVNPEIRYASCFEGASFSSGVVAFQPGPGIDPRQIEHEDKDVVCQVLKGTGRLRVKNRKVPLRPGTFCHIRKGTPHDFAAGKGGELVLFYSLIKTAGR